MLPASTEAAFSIVILTWSLSTPQGPEGLSDVSVNTTVVPISVASGTYSAFKVFASGVNDPSPPLHTAELAPPPIVPESSIGVSEHIS